MSSGRVFSMLERAKVVCWFEETHSLAMAARRYRAEFGMEPPKMESIKKWHNQFMTTGSIEKSSSAFTNASPSLAQSISTLNAEKNYLNF